MGGGRIRVQAPARAQARGRARRQARAGFAAARCRHQGRCGMIGGFTTAHLLYLVHSIWWTLVLSALAFVLGSIGGFGIMLARISPRRWLRRTALVYIEAIQGIP